MAIPNTLGLDRARWQRGLALDAFVAGSGNDGVAIVRQLRDVQLDLKDRARFAELTTPTYALALVERWCSDSQLYLPILARIVEAAPGLELRIVVRSEEPSLDAAYAARALRATPVFSFFNGQLREIGSWVARPQIAHERYDAWLAEHPEAGAIRADRTLNAETKQIRLRDLLTTLRVQREHLYAEQFQAATVLELRTLLAALLPAPVQQA
jgi:Thioredoxin